MTLTRAQKRKAYARFNNPKIMAVQSKKIARADNYERELNEFTSSRDKRIRKRFIFAAVLISLLVLGLALIK